MGTSQVSGLGSGEVQVHHVEEGGGEEGEVHVLHEGVGGRGQGLCRPPSGLSLLREGLAARR
eukprot:7462209-Alexandrium_andersonii.AAC.1